MKLTLRTEALADLTADELRGIEGGAPSGLTCPITDCVVSGISNDPSCKDCITRMCF